ncbi:helix-turn-helix domain-containing protein [Actinosynnema sp. NPDC023587]|uniref:helix-turn-helix domain-containing protein n=1 Tax=Actinosynnema sp. NPDC023587 TaxID=3154695 RepID=UPI0033E08E4F
MSGRLAELLRQHRARTGLTQSELAAVSGVSLRAISDIERAHAIRPQQRTVDALAAALALHGEALDRFRRSARPRRTGRSAVRARRTAPDDAPIGRERDSARLGALLTGGAVVVLHGPRGVGKSTLARHAARLWRDRFPDGRVVVDLRGSEADPTPPAVVFGAVLDALGAPPRSGPRGTAELARLCRLRLRDRKVLLVFEDAADEEQVRPLLVHGAGSAVLVTGGQEQAWPGLAVGPLEEAAAGALFAAVVGARRVEAEPLAAQRIVRACGGLPVALRVIGLGLARSPRWTLGDAARKLDRERGRQAPFAVAYRRLGGEAALALRRLALSPVAEVTAETAAEATGLSPAAAEGALDDLVETGFLDADRRLHDLVRAFARSRLHAEEDPGATRPAEVRVVRALLAGSGGQRTRVLRAGIDLGLCDDVSAAVRRWDDAHAWTTVFALGVHAARMAGDRHAEAAHLNRMGRACALEDRLDTAIELHVRAREVAAEVGAPDEEASALIHRGVAELRAGRPGRALSCVDTALPLVAADEDDSRLHLARSLRGRLLDAVGRHAEAVTAHHGAVARLRGDLGCDTPSLAIAAARWGNSLAALGRWREACAAFRESERLFQASGMSFDAARAGLRIASALLRLGRRGDAQRRLEEVDVVLRDGLWPRPASLLRALDELADAGGKLWAHRFREHAATAYDHGGDTTSALALRDTPAREAPAERAPADRAAGG